MRKLERGAYVATTIGILGDQISTRLALTKSWIYEGNPFSSYLMEQGLWVPFDIFILMTIIGGVFIILRKWGFENRWVILFFPYIYGIVRMIISIWNLYLFFRVV